MQKTKAVCNRMWKKWKLHPQWSYHYKEGVLWSILRLMDNKVRCADFPTRYQLIPADGPNRHSTLKMAAHLPAPGNSTWDVGLTLSPKHSRRTRSTTREMVDVNVLGRRWPGGIFPPQRPETSSMTGVYSASPKYPGDPFQWPGKILPLKNKIDLLSQ